MMVSTVQYPSFKSLGLALDHALSPRCSSARLFVGCILILREKILYYVLPAFFTAYLIYGFVRPSLSRAWRREIEEEDDEPDGDELNHAGLASHFARRRSPVLSARCCFPRFPSGRSISPSSTKARNAAFSWALLIGLGASAMEVIYCAISFTGFSSFFDTAS